MRQAANIRSWRTGDFQGGVWRLPGDDGKAIDRHRARLTWDVLPRPRQFVQAAPALLDCAVHRRNLRDLTAKGFERRLHRRTREVVSGALRSEERRVGKECSSRWSPYQ